MEFFVILSKLEKLIFKNQGAAMYLRSYNGKTELVYEPNETLGDIELLAKRLECKNSRAPLGSFDGIWGIPAGGQVLAVCLHYRLGLPLLLAPTKRSIIAEDIVDTGETISHYIKKGMFCASLFYNRKSAYKPDIWVREKENDIYDWVRFVFWEGMESKGV